MCICSCWCDVACPYRCVLSVIIGYTDFSPVTRWPCYQTWMFVREELRINFNLGLFLNVYYYIKSGQHQNQANLNEITGVQHMEWSSSTGNGWAVACCTRNMVMQICVSHSKCIDLPWNTHIQHYTNEDIIACQMEG